MMKNMKTFALMGLAAALAFGQPVASYAVSGTLEQAKTLVVGGIRMMMALIRQIAGSGLTEITMALQSPITLTRMVGHSAML